MNALVEVILPVFLVIGFGYVAARWAGFNEAAVDSLMRFSQNFALPCLLFKTVASIDLAAQAEQGLFLSFYLGAFLCFVIGYLAARHIFDRQPEDSIAIGFAAMFSNSFLLGVPITERAYGAGALAGNFTVIALHGPIFYTFGIMVMEITRSQQAASRTLMLLPQILFAVLRQPLVIGVLSGVVVNLSGLAVPTTLTAALNFIASAAVPVALFGLGGVLTRYRPEGDMTTIAVICTLSIIVHPAITYGLGRWAFHLNVDQLRSAVMTAAMAPGVNAYLFANLYGVAKRVNASSLLIGTALSIFTIWGWLHILP